MYREAVLAMVIAIEQKLKEATMLSLMYMELWIYVFLRILERGKFYNITWEKISFVIIYVVGYTSMTFLEWQVYFSITESKNFHLKHNESYLCPGAMAYDCNLSTLRVQSGQITWGQSSKTSLANIAKPRLY